MKKRKSKRKESAHCRTVGPAAIQSGLETCSTGVLVAAINTILSIIRSRGVKILDWDDKSKAVWGCKMIAGQVYILTVRRGITGDSHDGLLYLIDLDNGEIYISTEGAALRPLTDDRLDRILDRAYEDASAGNYADSALTVLQDAQSFILEGIPEDQYNYSSETGERIRTVRRAFRSWRFSSG